MTTLELIEKHGIGFNCLSDAYDLGWQKGREDTIEEFINRLCEYMGIADATKYENKDAEQMHRSYDTFMCYEIKDSIDDVAEQMKEQKHE